MNPVNLPLILAAGKLDGRHHNVIESLELQPILLFFVSICLFCRLAIFPSFSARFSFFSKGFKGLAERQENPCFLRGFPAL